MSEPLCVSLPSLARSHTQSIVDHIIIISINKSTGGRILYVANHLLNTMLPFLRRFGKAALAIELSSIGGLYYIFHDINTGGNESRKKWDERLPFLIDSFHALTGDDRVIEHRKNNSYHGGDGGAPSD